jgi:hypothetical protein
MIKKNNYYVYCYIDTKKDEEYNIDGLIIKGKPFYIGKGIRNRDISHLKLFYKRPFYSKLESMKKVNNIPLIIRLKENLSEDEAYEYETYYITKLKIYTDGGPLYNMNYGGKGGTTPNEDIRHRISLKNSGKYEDKHGKEKADAIKKKQSLSHSGEKNQYYGKKHTDEIRAKMRRKYYVLDLKNGKISLVEDMQQFCKENKVPLSSLIEISNKFCRCKEFMSYKITNDVIYEHVEKWFKLCYKNKKYLKTKNNRNNINKMYTIKELKKMILICQKEYEDYFWNNERKQELIKLGVDSFAKKYNKERYDINAKYKSLGYKSKISRDIIIQCIETGKIYKSVRSAELDLHIPRSSIINQIRYGKTDYKYHFVKYEGED